MNARVESMGGTTLAIMMPSTLAISRLAGEKRLRSRMPHSSAVCSRTVRRRQWKTRSRPSKAPMVILLLPASRASSTYASCKNQGIGSIVPAHAEEPRGVEARGGSGDGAARLIDGHAPSGDVAGSVSEKAKDGFGVFHDEGIDGGKEGEQNVLARQFAAGVPAERGGQVTEAVWKLGLVHVDADACDGLAIHQLHQDAGGLAVVEHQVVGPAQVALDAGGLGDGFDGGDAQREGKNGSGRQHQRAVDSGAGFGVPSVAVTSLASQLFVSPDDGSGFAAGGGPLSGIEGLEVEDLALGERHAETGEVDHRSAPCNPSLTVGAPIRAATVRERFRGSAGKRGTLWVARRLTTCPTIITPTPGGS